MSPTDPQPELSERCACSGVRWCARCRDASVRQAWKLDDVVALPGFLCPPPELGAEEPGGPVHRFEPAQQCVPTLPEFAGVHLLERFLDPSDARRLLAAIERAPFQRAQSGKGKQHHGARVNFNQRRAKLGAFMGLPSWAHELVDRLHARAGELPSAFASFAPSDVFVLRYDPASASNLDFHVDDAWAYGEGILALSLESDSVMTFVPGDESSPPADAPLAVRVPLPARSLALLWGPARYAWQHAILADDIHAQRTSVTIRCLGDGLAATEAGQALKRLAARSSGSTW